MSAWTKLSLWRHDSPVPAWVPVAEIVRNGLDRGFSFDTALVGAKLALAMTTGQEAFFTLDEVASALGCTKEDAEAEMEQLGISPIKATTLPGFEWALGENR